jgi:hypothetical protein
MTSLYPRRGCYRALGRDSRPVPRVSPAHFRPQAIPHMASDGSLRPNLNSALCGDCRQIDGAQVTKGDLEATLVIKPRLKQSDLVSRDRTDQARQASFM